MLVQVFFFFFFLGGGGGCFKPKAFLPLFDHPCHLKSGVSPPPPFPGCSTLFYFIIFFFTVL